MGILLVGLLVLSCWMGVIGVGVIFLSVMCLCWLVLWSRIRILCMKGEVVV